MEQVEFLLSLYSLEDILEQNDIEESFVLNWLIEEGMINLEEYFEDAQDDD